MSTQEDRLDPGLRKLLGVVLLGGLMGLVDSTIVNVGMDTLAGRFDSSLATVGWVATGYLLAVTAAIPLTAWAVDRFGARRMWLVGLAVFTGFSLASGLAWDVPSLITFRVLQGFGGGMLDPIMLTLLARAAGQARVGRVMGLMGIVIPLGPVLGPILGGLIIDGLDWRWMFLINVPIGVLAFLLSLPVVPTDPVERGGARLDILGLALLTPGFGALVFALSRASEGTGIGSTPVVVALALGVLLLLGYGAHALRAGRDALIDLALFRSRSFAAAVTVMGLTGVMLFSSLFLVPLYYQLARDFDVLRAGLLLAPLGVGSFVGMPIAGRLSDKVGTRALVPAGAAVIAVSTLVLTQVDAGSSLVLLAACALLTGLGLGFVGAPTMGSLYRTLPAESISQGTSALYIVNQLGASAGIAVSAMLLQGGASGAKPTAEDFHGPFWWVFAAALGVLLSGLLLPGKPPAAPTPSAAAAEPDGQPASEVV
ncbi:DHA2 family efflux MFS transporter permease subunit [Actinokineospora auranticolor]|uniref:EmrB/QacA subfamily drug resistance transporter n=1 Tax=Actinokineospora auranticolor TaxID=155976 RepID=A0A2S6GLR1_9PSEU|nr:DHA2 family efflux MFS transporter permease subunit [Actinokineospora auranticolor]PPK66174.1 EmrB/QacA subfamily drug resistance transporter [Actinokineospora auranticolor]